MPGLIDLAHDPGDRLVARRAKRELAHDRKQFRLLTLEAAQPREVRPEHRRRVVAAGQGRPESRHRVREHRRDEGFLGGEVVMQRRDVDLHRGGDLARAESLEPSIGEDAIRRQDEALSPRLGM